MSVRRRSRGSGHAGRDARAPKPRLGAFAALHDKALHEELRAIVGRHGLDAVNRALREIGKGERRVPAARRAPPAGTRTQNRNGGGRMKPNAVTCVGRMGLPDDRRSVPMEAGAVQKNLDNGYYSGPARSGPIADAIRKPSSERIRAYNERNGLPDAPEPVSAAGAGDPDGGANDRNRR